MSDTSPTTFDVENRRVGGVPMYPDVRLYMAELGGLLVWEGDGWKEESMSWKTGCYVAENLSNPMAQMTYSGPGAQELLSRTSINNVYQWPIGTSKHLVQTDENGLIANHGLAIRDGEQQFRMLACGPWPAMMAGPLGVADVEVRFEDIFILQVGGPTSIQVLERALGKNLHDVKFLEVRAVEIPGIDAGLELSGIELSRIGMVGTLAYELRGPIEHGPAVYDAVYRAGKDFGIKRLGWRTYTVNHNEGGFPQATVTMQASSLRNPQTMEAWPLVMRMSGSVDPEDVRARLRTPQEVNWAWMAKFDHEFIGREAVESEAANPKRKTVTLRWNPEDVLDVFASHYRPGEEYQYIEFPSSPQAPAAGHQDLVTKDGVVIGYSSATIYSYYYREQISMCVIDIDQAEIGNEVVVHWGDYGKRIKEIRATVERFPYLDLPRNEAYDLDAVTSGVR